MYVPTEAINRDIFYQGDLIRDFPFLIYDKDLLDVSLEKDSEVNIEIKIKPNLAMMLSQTCDIQRRANILACPVYRMCDFSFKKDEAESIRKRRVGYWFYLPKLNGVIEESIADFQTIYHTPRSLLEKHKENKIITLTDWGRHHLGWSLAYYFGRPIESKE